MRRRKKDKALEKGGAVSSADNDTMDSSGKGRSSSSNSKPSKFVDVASNNSNAVTVVSPPQQQRKRSLLGSLGSMRDLVEQVNNARTSLGYVLPWSLLLLRAPTALLLMLSERASKRLSPTQLHDRSRPHLLPKSAVLCSLCHGILGASVSF